MSDYEINLGREVPDYGGEMATPASESPKQKTKTVYPSLYITGGNELEDIPAEGCCIIRYKRTQLTTRERDDDDSECSVDLEVHSICPCDSDGAAEAGNPDYGSGNDLVEGFEQFLKTYKQ
jgi:hypothetical protein